ncbi:MAG: hypothetical protein PWQ54_1890 [Bacteroidales bacterium]|nr:hypothetical protein [Bacteroidales bacterium]
MKQLPIALQNKFVCFIALIVFTLTISTRAISQEQNDTFYADQWLILPAQSYEPPLFYQQEDTYGDTLSLKNLFDRLGLPAQVNPIDGKPLVTDQNGSPLWEKQQASKSGELILKPLKNSTYSWTLAAGYFETDRLINLTFTLKSSAMASLAVDGQTIIEASNKAETDKTLQHTFEPGKHLILIKTMYASASDDDWKLSLKYELKSKGTINWSADSEKHMNMGLLLDGIRLTSSSIHFSGKYLMLNYSYTHAPEGKTENWTEVMPMNDESILFSNRHSDKKQIKFHPTADAIIYVVNSNGTNSLWQEDLLTGKTKLLLEELKDAGNIQLSPKGNSLVYSKQFKEKEDNTGVKKHEGMPDRWPWWRNRSQLFLVDLQTGTHHQLTAGNLSSQFQDFSPEGNKILFSQSKPDYSERPYSKSWMILLNLKSRKADTLWISNYGSSALFSPDGKQLLVTGGPLLFGQSGNTLSQNDIPNDYDTQAYLFDLNTKNSIPLSRNFHPKILDARWNKANGNPYFLVQEGSYQRIYLFDITTNNFLQLQQPADVVKHFNMDYNGQLMIADGSSVSSPDKAWITDLNTQQTKIISDPEANFFEDVVFGEVKDWDFITATGDTLDGHIYYPPDFDPAEKYPVIVYYYGGTNPIDRSFRGRYPKNYFAAHGYLVYVIIPSGATGYGQEFSARHVNNWGKTVADEIINGTKHFYRSHPYADSNAIGCIGASYGGFMTMLLTTRTDIFSAAIAHAGISSISSYWGEGYWGYLYSSTATANEFPWNSPKIYIDQSPLFAADKINTPLLLLHGGSDTNVPPGESIQLYTALKLLGKTAEYIEIEGQDHHIVDYKKRQLWQKSIIAWFDRFLKDQPAWWESLYPERKL